MNRAEPQMQTISGRSGTARPSVEREIVRARAHRAQWNAEQDAGDSRAALVATVASESGQSLNSARTAASRVSATARDRPRSSGVATGSMTSR